MSSALRVLVIGDSTAFTDHRGPQPQSADHLYPNVLRAGVPAAVQALVPFVRPAPLRRAVRRGLQAAYPRLVALRRGHGARTRPEEFARLYALLLDQVQNVTWPLVAHHLDGPNPDGIHWPPEAHTAIGRALADALAPQLTGDRRGPGRS